MTQVEPYKAPRAQGNAKEGPLRAELIPLHMYGAARPKGREKTHKQYPHKQFSLLF